MLNVTPLLSINSSIQTSWGPGLWPCTPPVSLPEAGEACLLAQPPHLTTGPSHMHKHTQTHTKSKGPAKSYIQTSVQEYPHTSTGAGMHATTCKFTEGVRAHLLEEDVLKQTKTHTHTHTHTHAHTHTHTHVDTRTCPLATLLVHRATGRLCSIPLKVLWAVISKTIPWMAALIENNEGHIEHMVAVVSPFPPSSLLFSPSLTLSLSPTPPDKRFSQTLPLPSKDLCGEWKKKGHRQSCSLFLLTS